MRRLRVSVLVALSVAGSCIAGCSGSGQGNGTANPSDASAIDDTMEGGTIDCTADKRADTYVADLTKAGTSNLLKFVLVSGAPAPPIKGNNTWTVKVMDAAGTAIPDATIDVKPFMPDHGHGTSAKASVTANGDGTYTIEPLYLFMPGLWQVTLTAKAGTTTDSVVYAFCVEG